MTQSYSRANLQVSLSDGGVLYRDSHGVERNLSWEGMKGVGKSVFSRTICIKGREGTAPISFLTQEEQSAFLTSFYGMWRSRNPDAAKKNAFDFVDRQRGFAWTMLFMGGFFFLPLGVVMLQDSLGQLKCNRMLAQNSAWTTAQVLKAKKKRKGHFIFTLEFSGAGQPIKAMDQYFTADEAAEPPKEVPVLYSPENPQCWIMGKITEPGAAPIPHKEKRKFFTAYLSIFGFILALIGAMGLIWSFFRFKEKNPHRETVRALFQFQ